MASLACDLRQVGDAQDLAVGGDLRQPSADDFGYAAPDSGVHFVEDQRRDG